MKKWILVTLGSILFMIAFIWFDQLNVQISIPTGVILTGVIVFFIEKNGWQTRKKIQDEFDELHERLHKEKQEKEQQADEKFTFVQQEETQQPDT